MVLYWSQFEGEIFILAMGTVSRSLRRETFFFGFHLRYQKSNGMAMAHNREHCMG